MLSPPIARFLTSLLLLEEFADTNPVQKEEKDERDRVRKKDESLEKKRLRKKEGEKKKTRQERMSEKTKEKKMSKP